MVCFQLIRVLSPYISEPTLLFVLFSSSGVSLRWFIRYDANRTLVCPCFYAIAWTELIFFFFSITISFIYFEFKIGTGSRKILWKELMNCAASSMKVPKCQPSVNIFRIQKTLEAISTTLLAELFSPQDRTFFLNS